jgi:nicotinic acid mononucleotide adenylyltransferase
MNKFWKIGRDSFYNELYQQQDMEYIERLGFFLDSNENNINVKSSVHIMCTPFGSLTTDSTDEKTCVLITTGGFAPLHQGHIAMMEAAKKTLEQDGWTVANGYFAPDHDEYINNKCGDKAIDAFTRIGIINELTKDIPWLTVDPWPAVFNSCSINFTDIIDRLEAYLLYHIKKPVTVFYVCGGDNARFSMVFENKGHCVVVGRPRYDNLFQMYDRVSSKLNADKRIYFTFTDGVFDVCSKDIRERGDVKHHDVKNLTLLSAGHELTDNVVEAMKPHFGMVNLVVKDRFHIKNNLDWDRTICLDKDIYSKYKIGVSRQYDIFGLKYGGQIASPGFKDFNKQVLSIPKGEYVLFDSDIHTGKTVSAVTKELESHGIEIIKSVALVPKNDEILDVEDFILDSGAGLVVQVPSGEKIRVPYVLPYVNCRERCSSLDPVLFSLTIWEINRDYFKGNPKNLEDIGKAGAIFRMAGFKDSTPMEHICKWHIAKIKNEFEVFFS